MITLAKEFQSNANVTGMQTFAQIKSGSKTVVNRRNGESRNQNVYIYSRTRKDGTVFGWEVVVPHVKPAGTYKLPTPTGEEQKYITYPEDVEEYPGASAFGRLAWFCDSEARAEEIFNDLLKEKEKDKEQSSIPIPTGEFTVTEYAELLGVSYVHVSNWVKDQMAVGKIKIVRREHRHARGRATNILAAA